MKALCPQCGEWTDDDWTDGPFGVCCWACRYAYAALWLVLDDDDGLRQRLGRMLAHAYLASRAARRPVVASGGGAPVH